MMGTTIARAYKRSRPNSSLDLDLATTSSNTEMSELHVEGYSVPSLKPGLKTRVFGGFKGAISRLPRPHSASGVPPAPSLDPPRPDCDEDCGDTLPLAPPFSIPSTPLGARTASAPPTPFPRLHLDTRLPMSTPPLGTPTSDESEAVIGVSVVRAVQGYFKHLLALLREDGAFDELRPWILRAPMCAFSPDLPAHLRPTVLALAEALATAACPEIMGSEGYLALVAPQGQGGTEERGSLEALVLSDLPALIVSAAVPSLNKTQLVLHVKRQRRAVMGVPRKQSW